MYDVGICHIETVVCAIADSRTNFCDSRDRFFHFINLTDEEFGRICKILLSFKAS